MKLKRSDGALDRLVRLQLFARALTTGIDATEVMNIVVRQGIASADADGGVLALIDGDFVVPIVTVGYAQERIESFGRLSVSDPLPLTAAVTAGPVFIASRDELAQRFPVMMNKPIVSNAWAAIPLVVDGRPLGVLGLSFASNHQFAEEETMFLHALADLTALAVAPTRDEAQDAPRADVAFLQRVLIRMFGISMHLAAMSNNPTVNDGLRDQLRSVIAELDTFGSDCRRELFPSDFVSGD